MPVPVEAGARRSRPSAGMPGARGVERWMWGVGGAFSHLSRRDPNEGGTPVWHGGAVEVAAATRPAGRRG